MKSVPISKTERKRRERLRINLWCWAFVSMTLIFYVAFQGWPILSSIYFSLLNWSGLTKDMKFVGLANYKELLGDQLFWNAFINSFKYMVLVVPLQLVFSLFLAYLLNNPKLKGSSIYRTIYFVPVVTTAAIVGIVMVFIWGVNGPLNQMLVSWGILQIPINFFGEGKTAMSSLVAVAVWKDCGIYMIYWLAALQSVPRTMYEAAMVDGAGRFRTFRSIVMPMILPTAGVISILCVISSLKVFDIVKTMTEGGPFYATDVIATYVYRMAFSSEMGMPRLGYASAAALLFGITIIIIGAVLNMVKKVLNQKRYN
ncbi:sugar ABC transporter permease [Clostridiales bacterium COT073_COT-073]|nr:sugar ABC transporter permease [Clostridiales bacterium COT073_COT-073]